MHVMTMQTSAGGICPPVHGLRLVWWLKHFTRPNLAVEEVVVPALINSQLITEQKDTFVSHFISNYSTMAFYSGNHLESAFQKVGFLA